MDMLDELVFLGMYKVGLNLAKLSLNWDWTPLKKRFMALNWHAKKYKWLVWLLPATNNPAWASQPHHKLHLPTPTKN